MGTAEGCGSVGGAIWPCVFEKAWAAFLAETAEREASYDLIQAEDVNPLQARCTIDEVCASLARRMGQY